MVMTPCDEVVTECRGESASASHTRWWRTVGMSRRDSCGRSDEELPMLLQPIPSGFVVLVAGVVAFCGWCRRRLAQAKPTP